jgi:DNA-binding HxlR family transcriptional regulator
MVEDICPVQETLKIVKGKFAVVVLEEIANGYDQYGLLSRKIPTINSRVLATRLREFEEFGILWREVLPTNPPQVRYHFTAKGEGLTKLVAEITNWYETFEEK